MAGEFTNESVSSANVLEMYTVANEYCLFTEKAEKYPLDDVVQYYTKILPLLYLKGALLQLPENDEDYFGERFITEEQWENIFHSLRTVFGSNDEFYNLLNLTDENTVAKASISEHLADVYQDLKDFVIQYQRNFMNAKLSAIIDCRNLFITHWGPRIAAVLSALHALAFKSENDEELY